jgi:DNA-binding transcriptional ArsR family regulator
MVFEVSTMDKETTAESLEESIFKTLSHQKRRDILRIIGEKKEVTFTEIKMTVQIEDSPSLSYHLNTMGGLIIQKEGKYMLSELGQDAFGLICKTITYSASNSILSFLRRQIPAVIIANAVLWALALLLTSQFEGNLKFESLASFAVLWFISNIILYSILTRVKQTGNC